MSEWTDLVKKTYAGNKHKPNYKLGDAMKDAKKVYKKGGLDKEPEKSKKNTSRKGKK